MFGKILLFTSLTKKEIPQERPSSVLSQSPSQKSQSKPTGKNKEKFDGLFSELLKWHYLIWVKKKNQVLSLHQLRYTASCSLSFQTQEIRYVQISCLLIWTPSGCRSLLDYCHTWAVRVRRYAACLSTAIVLWTKLRLSSDLNVATLPHFYCKLLAQRRQQQANIPGNK